MATLMAESPTETRVFIPTRTASTNTQVRVSTASPFVAALPSAYVSSMVGRLPGNRKLARPIIVTVEPDDGEVLVSEPHFHMHAVGPTEGMAVEAFFRMLSGYLDFLSADEDTLGEHLADQLAYLRDIIQPA